MKTMLLVIGLLAVLGMMVFDMWCIAQNKSDIAQPSTKTSTAVAPLTADEEREIREAQIDYMSAALRFQSAQNELKAAQEAQQSAGNALNARVDKVFESRKLKQGGDVVLCNGPQPDPPCAGVPAKRLALREKAAGKKEKEN